MEDESTNWRDYRQGVRELIHVYGWIWKELLEEEMRRICRPLIFFIIMANAFAMMVPWLFGRVVDRLITHDVGETVASFAILAALMLMREWCLYRVGSYREIFLGSTQGSIDEQSNRLFMEKSLGQHLREHDKLSAANVEKGRARVHELINLLLFEGIETAFLVLLSFICLWILYPLGGLVMTCVLLIYVVWSLVLNRRVAEVCVPLDAEFRALNRHRVERWERVERVKTSGKETEEVGFMADWFHRLISKDRFFWLWFIRQVTWRSVVSTAALLIILALGVWCVWRGSWSLGMLYPVYTWSRFIADNLWRLSSLEHRLGWNLPAIRSMKQALTITPDIQDKAHAVELTTQNGIRLEVRGVSHGYVDRESTGGAVRQVLRDVSFTVEPGKVVGLVGRSGAGKSTLMRLIQRGMDPGSGAILVDDQDLRDLRLSSWLALTGYIPQQPAVLDGTIRYNLLYGLTPDKRASVTDDELWQLMRELQIDFGARLTHGLDTLVGRSGIKLSGGEAQRLSIGSAVAKRPRFLLIDEATSSLDSTTEKAVQEGLKRALRGGVSALIIAHRLSTVRHICSKFVVLKRSEEVRAGESQVEAVADSFEALYKISPTFHDLANDQGIILAS